MRTMVTATAVYFGLLLAACPKPPAEPAPPSDYIHAPSSAEFYTVAHYSTLGDLWSAAGGASAIKKIHTDSQGYRALFELRGQGNTAFWLDFSQGRQLQELELRLPMQSADLDRQRVFLVDAPGANRERLLAANLPSLKTDNIWASKLVGGEIRGVAFHPNAKKWWFMVSSTNPTVENGETNAKVVLYQVDDANKGNATSLTAENISPDCQMVCLADGSLMINSNGFVYIANNTNSQPRKVFAIPSGRQATVFADTILNDFGWVFLKPRGSGGGTGRSGAEAKPGKLICINQQGQERASIETGSVPFGDIVGDWTKRRCILLQDSVGVAYANLREGTMTWPLRVRDDISLFLLPNAGEIWAMLPDAIVGIGLDELVELGSNLAADKVIEGDLMEGLRPAVKALGWKWSEVQVSPLMSQTGKLTLFDTADPDSTWSQLDWSTSKNRATGLLVARVPTPGDHGATNSDFRAVDAWCKSIIGNLGWKSAELIDGNRDEYGLHYTYALVPNAKPPLTSGEFQVWITDSAAYYSLEGATFEFPANSLGIGEARLLAAKKIAAAAGISSSKLLVSKLPQAGWLTNESSGQRFLNDAQEGATPCFRLQAIRNDKSTGRFVIYLDAISGEVLHQVEDRFSPLANLGVTGGKYSKVGE